MVLVEEFAKCAVVMRTDNGSWSRRLRIGMFSTTVRMATTMGCECGASRVTDSVVVVKPKDVGAMQRWAKVQQKNQIAQENPGF